MLKMIFFDEDPDEVLKEEDIRESTRPEVERIDFRDTEEVFILIISFLSYNNDKKTKSDQLCR